jgi:hypothetical protein
VLPELLYPDELLLEEEPAPEDASLVALCVFDLLVVGVVVDVPVMPATA